MAGLGMEIAKDTVVSIDYTLKGNDGNVIDSSEGREPLAYLHGHANIVPGLENALTGKQTGDQVDVKVLPSEGYGEVDERLVQRVPKANFPADADLEPGMAFQAQVQGQPMVFRIEEVGAADVKVNGNHPLAGQDLNFSVTVREVRKAEPSEIAHGHVHQGGHHHHH